MAGDGRDDEMDVESFERTLDYLDGIADGDELDELFWMILELFWTILEPNTLEGFGRVKIDRLNANGIYSVEQLATLNLMDTKLCKKLSKNQKRGKAVALCVKWKAIAKAYLKRQRQMPL